MTTNTLLQIADVCSELQLSELEVRRAVAKGHLAATEISGWDPSKRITKKPEWRFTRDDLEKYITSPNFGNARLPPGFVDQRGGLLSSADAASRLRAFWTNHLRDNQQWERAFRQAWQVSGFHSPTKVNKAEANYGTSIPDEVLEFSRRPALGGLAGRLAQQESRDPRDPSTFTVGQSVIFNKARAAARAIVRSDFPHQSASMSGVSLLTVLYSTPAVYRQVLRSVTQRVTEDTFYSRPIEVELKLEDLSPNTLQFMGYGTFSPRALLTSSDYARWIANAF